MSKIQVKADNLSKIFNRRLIFKELNFNFDSPGIYGVSGINGAGKSTLVKIISGLLSPSKGTIIRIIDDKVLDFEKLHNHIGLVSPYLVLYDEFTASENLELFAQIRGIKYNASYINDLLKRFLLYERRDDYVKTYSSGMKQRLKFIFALMHQPEILIFDEPTSNLDNDGKETVYSLIIENAKKSIVIVASNEEVDLSYCSTIINLAEYKNK